MHPSVFLLAGCASTPSRPPLVPPDAVHITIADRELSVDGVVVQLLDQFSQDPTEPIDPVLREVLAGRTGQPVWIEMPADTPFWAVRRVARTAKDAGLGVMWLSSFGDRVAGQLLDPLGPHLPPCNGEPMAAGGVASAVTVSVQGDATSSWVIATARFLPVTDRGPTDAPLDCLRFETCEAAFSDPASREACTQGATGADAPGRVGLAGEWGCLLPIAKEPEQAQRWRTELARLSPVLGFADVNYRILMPEAKARVDAIVPVLAGMAEGGAATPVGMTLLVEGNDGAPACTSPIRSKAELNLAGARWFGGQLAQQAAEPGKE